MRVITLLLAILAVPLTARAGDCVANLTDYTVPPTWAGATVFTGATAVQEALDSGCVDIGLYCPDISGRCTSEPFVIDGLIDITLTSLELEGEGGAVEVAGNGWALSVLNSENIVMQGLDLVESFDLHALRVLDSNNVTITGLPTLAIPRYTTFRATAGIAVSIEGASVVSTNLVAAVESFVGFAINGEAHVESKGLVIRLNVYPALLDSVMPYACPADPVLSWKISSDFGPTWLNYIVENDRFAMVGGTSRLEIEHAVIAGNSRCPFGVCDRREASVFAVEGASSMSIRNAAFYDNDEDPGMDFSTGGSSGIANGTLVYFATCGEVDIESSTIYRNASEDLFKWDWSSIGGLGPLRFKHSIISTSGHKVFSHSNVTCAAVVEPLCSVEQENAVLADPASCGNGDYFLNDEWIYVLWDQADGAQALDAMSLPEFPRAVPPYRPLIVEGTSLIDPEVWDYGCYATPVSSSLFPDTAANWSVSYSEDHDQYPLDVGFHNVYPL